MSVLVEGYIVSTENVMRHEYCDDPLPDIPLY